MATKDHSLDAKITKAAFDEFMEKGFQKASLHKIAENAGLTTGAIYTRYKNKDMLFRSLIEDLIQAMMEKASGLADNYYAVKDNISVEAFLKAMSTEMDVFFNVIFEYYDECILFFCRSEGSSVSVTLNQVMQMKAEQTVQFLKDISTKEFKFEGVDLLINSQLNFFREILNRRYTREKTIACLKTYETFAAAGWTKLFEEII